MIPGTEYRVLARFYKVFNALVKNSCFTSVYIGFEQAFLPCHSPGPIVGRHLSTPTPKVPPTLHTPLMSGSNAISGITLIGAIIVCLVASSTLSLVLGSIAVALATVNVVGGFLVTHRMLAMFKSKKKG